MTRSDGISPNQPTTAVTATPGAGSDGSKRTLGESRQTDVGSLFSPELKHTDKKPHMGAGAGAGAFPSTNTTTTTHTTTTTTNTTSSSTSTSSTSAEGLVLVPPAADPVRATSPSASGATLITQASQAAAAVTAEDGKRGRGRPKGATAKAGAGKPQSAPAALSGPALPSASAHPQVMVAESPARQSPPPLMLFGGGLSSSSGSAAMTIASPTRPSYAQMASSPKLGAVASFATTAAAAAQASPAPRSALPGHPAPTPGRRAEPQQQREPSVTHEVTDSLRSLSMHERVLTAHLPASVTCVITSPKCLGHVTTNQESAGRLEVLVGPTGVLRASEFQAVEFVEECPPARLVDVTRVHDFEYVNKLRAQCEALEPGAAPKPLAHPHGDDLDTQLSRGTFVAAMHAAGAVTMAVDRVIAGEARNVFCAVRPPGHHAGPSGLEHANSQGFCLLNNVAIGAAYAMDRHRDRIRRVAIVDFDVHHGDGTQACVEHVRPRTKAIDALGLTLHRTSCKPWLDPDTDPGNILFASSHLYNTDSKDGPFFPASGGCSQHPVGGCSHRDGPSVINVHYTPTESRKKFFAAEFRPLFTKHVLDPVRDFRPDMIFISAGFDAHGSDTKGNALKAHMTEDDFYWMTKELREIADSVCGGRLVSVLEGGYHLEKPNKPATRGLKPAAPSVKMRLSDHCTLAQSVAAHVAALMNIDISAQLKAE